jgi:isoquinoline 1-oxidoreductase subunit beta
LIDHSNLTRRSLLKWAGSGALALTVHLPAQAESAAAQANGLGAFIRIAADGPIEFIVPCVEMGQGSQTALAMILADELGADWSQVSVKPPPIGVVYRTPGRPMQSTTGSQMVRRWNAPLRKSAAAAREMLTAAAAAQWGVAVESCSVKDSFVLHGPTQRRLAFRELVAAAAQLPTPKEPVLRDGASLVGKSLPRIDIPSKVDGSARYGIDVRVPGMLYAAIRQSPVYGAKLLSVNENGVRSRRGVVDIVKLPDAVAVVADSFWRAKSAVALLEPVFAESANAKLGTRDIMAAQRRHLDAAEAPVAFSTGSPQTTAAGAKNQASADYEVQFLHHVTMEPMTCTISVTDTACELWVSSQNLTGAVDTAARVTGIPVERITVHPMLLGGGFGRKFEQDAVEQAALIGKAIKHPVQLLWSREEDVQHGFYRPAMTARVSGFLDSKGDIESLTIRAVGPSVVEHTIGTPLIKGIDPVAVMGLQSEAPGAPAALQQYSIKNVRAEYVYQPTHVPVGYWRSVGASENAFFIDSFFDEAAARSGSDPYLYRRRHMSASPRAIAVLDKAAAEIGWNSSRGAGRHVGIAFADCVGSLVALAVEISVKNAAVKVHRAVCAIDCGTAVNPDNVVAQVQGALIMGFSAAMTEQITIEGGRCVQSNLHDYPVLALRNAPAIAVHIVNSGAPLGGVGEAAVPTVAPALCNAIHAATGKRLRSLPLIRSGYMWA